MSYTITYSPDNKKKYPLLSDRKRNFYLKILISCVCIVILAVLISPIGYELRQAVGTDSMRITEEAAAVFSAQLTAGETVYDALRSFCRYILENA